MDYKVKRNNEQPYGRRFDLPAVLSIWESWKPIM